MTLESASCHRRIVLLSLLSCLIPVAPSAAGDALTGPFMVEPLTPLPVFQGQPGAWDEKIRERGWIIRDESGWRLWYTGYRTDQQPPMMRLGLATSPDGLAWQRHLENPLIEDVWVEDMMIVRHEGRYLMFAEGFADQAQLLESPDGLHWSRTGTLDVRLQNGQPIPAGPYGTPTVIRHDDQWNLFYERRDAGIWRATSPDLKTWTNVSDEPAIRPGPGDYDGIMIALNQILLQDDRFIAVLHGTGTPSRPRQWCTYLAQSSDLTHWEKSPSGPLRPVTENQSSGQLVHDGTGWRLYTMHDQVRVHRVLTMPR